MRRTLKYEAALDCAAELLDRAELNRARKDNATLYDALERRGWFYDRDNGKWQHYKPSTSMFQADDGGATGVFRLRVMCEPRDLDRLLEIVNEALDTYGATITEQSNVYPNRRGPGVRCYLTGKLPEPKKGEE